MTEGKFSFPIIHSITAEAEDPALLSESSPALVPASTQPRTEILRQRTKDTELKRFAVRLMQQSGSFDYTLRVLNELEQAIREEIDKLGGNSLLMSFVESLSVSKLK